MHSVPIGKVVEKVATWNPSKQLDGDFDYIDLSAVDQANKCITAPTRMPAAQAPSRARQIVRTGDILVSTVRPNLNGVARAVDEHDGMTASTGFCVLRPIHQQLDSSYLFQWVRSPSFVGDMMRKATGASYPAVSDRIIKDSEIPLPPLDEQRRVAAILDKADQLRQKRRQAIALLDSLTQSIFLDMFGDPVSNPKGWERVPLGEVADFMSGGTPSKSSPSFWVGQIPWVSPKDMKSVIVRDSIDHISEKAIQHSAAKLAPVDSVLIVVRGMILAHTVPIAILDQQAAFNQDVKAVQFRDSIVPRFGLWNMLVQASAILKQVSTAAHGTKRLEMETVASLPILRPPIAFQRKFAEQCAKNEALIEQSMGAALSGNALFSSLQTSLFSMGSNSNER